MAERPRIAIVGSGRAGLACAAALAGRAALTLFERLPVLGGEDWEDPRVAALSRRVRASGAQIAAGTQAIRWEGDRVLGVGQCGGVFGADALVVATGHRPKSRAELRIGGTRCAGVMPATVALHLLGHGVKLGRRVVVAGSGVWAREVVARVVQGGADCTLVGAALPDFAGGAARNGDRVLRTIGAVRVEAVEVSGRHGDKVLRCDALVLADGRVPYRNVDGAVCQEPGVAFAQAANGDLSDSEALGRAAAGRALAAASGVRPHIPTTLRRGRPR